MRGFPRIRLEYGGVFMTTAGQIAIVLGMLALIAGGSTVAWVFLFYSAAKADRAEPSSAGSSPRLSDHA